MGGGKARGSFRLAALAGRTAFTLIELLVVVSIIALLLAVLVPALGRARKQGQVVACQGNLHKWGMIFQQYASEYEGRWFHYRYGITADLRGWFRELRGRYEDPNRYDMCPTKTWYPRHGRVSLSTYNLNGWLHTWEYVDGTRPAEMVHHWGNVHASRSPGGVPVFVDAYAYSWLRSTPDQYDEPPPYAGWAPAYMGSFCVPRHGSFVNGLFMDWSVRRVGMKELWTLKWHRDYDINGPWTKAGGVLPGDWPEWMRGFGDY